MNDAILSVLVTELSPMKRAAVCTISDVMEKIAALPLELSNEQMKDKLEPIFFSLASLLNYIG